MLTLCHHLPPPVAVILDFVAHPTQLRKLNIRPICHLIRMICVILSLIIGSNLVAVSFSNKSKSPVSEDLHLIKKSAFNSSYNKANLFKLSVTIRVCCLVRCIQIASLVLLEGVSAIQSCFSQVSLLVNLNRAGIALISPTPIKMLSVYSISLSVKRINPSGIFNSTFIQRALIATII